MQITAIDSLTTVACDIPPIFSISASSLPFDLLYFQIVLRFESENLNEEERTKVKRYLRSTTDFLGGKARAVGFNGDGIRLLVGLPPQVTLEDFVGRLRIVSKSLVRRKLNVKSFAWKPKYQISTVGFSQIEAIRHDIKRQDMAMSLIAPRLVVLETIH